MRKHFPIRLWEKFFRELEEKNLHPEWPTYKKAAGITYRKYRRDKTKKIYLPDPTGGPGFIDFAIGDYSKPEIGIEFSLKHGWVHEKMVYDFLKLMDRKLPFTTGISFYVIMRGKSLPRGKNVERLRRRMDEVYGEAVMRLRDDICSEERGLYFIIVEIDQGGERRQGEFDKKSRNFVLSTPQTPRTLETRSLYSRLHGHQGL